MHLSDMSLNELMKTAERTYEDYCQHEDEADYYSQLSPDENEEGYGEDELYSIENEERNAASYARSCLEDELYYIGQKLGREVSMTDFIDEILPEWQNNEHRKNL